MLKRPTQLGDVDLVDHDAVDQPACFLLIMSINMEDKPQKVSVSLLHSNRIKSELVF